MAEQQQVISAADLSTIESNLSSIAQDISVLDTRVTTVNSNVKVVYSQVEKINQEFHDYIVDERRRWELEHATSNLGNVRQELDNKFGYYAEVRRSTTGILQATDLGIVHNDTITKTTEDLMLKCPGYWLAPALVALASWINDDKDNSVRALKAALSRDDEKTSLMFSLICCRANRMDASLEWVHRYLTLQDPTGLGRETVVILDAYSAGLYSNDSENVIAHQLEEWIGLLSAEPGFLERQQDRWKVALNGLRKPIDTSSYEYLRQYSNTWPVLQDVLEGAALNGSIRTYFEDIYAQPTSQDAAKLQLDELLDSLVKGFDEEELPLRRQEREYELIIKYKGDAQRAKKVADAESPALANGKDFAQLLTDTAMHPELSHASTASQKFSIAYSRDWVSSAFNDLTAENRAKVPTDIEINIDTFNDKTQDGSDEPRLLNAFTTLVNSERESELSTCKLTTFEMYCNYGGFACIAVGLVALVMRNYVIGILAIIAGIGLVMKHYTQKKAVEAKRAAILAQYQEKQERGTQILKATIAEVVDFRSEFQQLDGQSDDVVSLLEQIDPSQYVKMAQGSTRKVYQDGGKN